MAAFV